MPSERFSLPACCTHLNACLPHEKDSHILGVSLPTNWKESASGSGNFRAFAAEKA